MSEHVERLARRVQGDDFFLAAPLALYATNQQLDDTALAARLGCDAAALTHLRLCRNPDPQPPHFWKDVERIAEHFRINADRLAEIVRFGQGLMKLRSPGQATGFLMAAREDEAGEPPPAEEML